MENLKTYILTAVIGLPVFIFISLFILSEYNLAVSVYMFINLIKGIF